MVEKNEQRADTRIIYKSPVKVEDLASGIIHGARMINYSKNGLCFETDKRLHPGGQIFIGIENSPYTSPSFRSYECYRARIMWRRKSDTIFFNYAYGVRYIFFSDDAAARNEDLKTGQDSRKYPRQTCPLPILSATDKRIFKCSTRNISPAGAYIESGEAVKPGQIIRLAVPIKGPRKAIIKSRVVWADRQGFGVKFLRVDKK